MKTKELIEMEMKNNGLTSAPKIQLLMNEKYGLAVPQSEIKEIIKASKLNENWSHVNHHTKLTTNHEIVNFGDGDFVANKEAVPLLKALNEVGLKTRTHHIDGVNASFVSILLDNVDIEIKRVNEFGRTKYNGKTELMIIWNNPTS